MILFFLKSFLFPLRTWQCSRRFSRYVNSCFFTDSIFFSIFINIFYSSFLRKYIIVCIYWFFDRFGKVSYTMSSFVRISKYWTSKSILSCRIYCCIRRNSRFQYSCTSYCLKCRSRRIKSCNSFVYKWFWFRIYQSVPLSSRNFWTHQIQAYFRIAYKSNYFPSFRFHCNKCTSFPAKCFCHSFLQVKVEWQIYIFSSNTFVCGNLSYYIPLCINFNTLFSILTFHLFVIRTLNTFFPN